MEHIEVEVLIADGATRDCTVGKVYKALLINIGMSFLNGSKIDSDGATFFDDAGELCAIRFSTGHVRLAHK